MESASVVKELVLTVHNHFARENQFAQAMVSVRECHASASKDGLALIAGQKAVKWFPTALVMATVSRENASVKKVGREIFAISNPLAQEIATTEGCV